MKAKGYIVFMPDGPEVTKEGVDYDKIPKQLLAEALLLGVQV